MVRTASVRTIARSALLRTLTFTAVAVAMPTVSRAQIIRIVDPPQWRDNRPVTMQVRAAFRIAGFASHPGGIVRVLVNGVPATLQPDPEFPDSYSFERSIPIDSLTSRITISIEPRSGAAYVQTYTLELPAAQQPAGNRTPPRGSSTQVQRPGPNPWGGFKIRGILYGVALVGGLAVSQLEKSETSEVCMQTGAGFDCFNRTRTTPSYQGIGFAAAGGAAAVFIIDAILTSKKAKSATGPTGDNDGFQIQAPAVSSTAEGVRVDLLRIRFR
jgi:hypothetical protein